MIRLHKMPLSRSSFFQVTAVQMRRLHRSAGLLQDKRPLTQAHGVPPPKANPTPGSSSGGGNGSGMMMGAAGLTAVGGGVAYYFFKQRSAEAAAEIGGTVTSDVKSNVTESKEDKPASTESSESSQVENKISKEETPAVEADTSTVLSKDTFDEETTETPSSGGEGAPLVESTTVLTKTEEDDISTTTTESTSPGDDIEQALVALKTTDRKEDEPEDETERALAALKTSITDAATEALLASHPTMWTATSVNTASSPPLADIETLSDDQLKIRVVQLATELKDRTKWEALRLKEFLAMKEQEVSAEYTKLMQKQRMEFEDLLAQRLREQEHVLRSQLEASLREKDATIQSLVDAALEAQKHDFTQEKEAYEAVTKAEMQQELEIKYSQQMEELKKTTAADLQEKVDALEELSTKVERLSEALSNSQNHQQGSAQAHRLSAAALNLSEKLATDQPAGPEIEALSTVAGSGGGVIATAVATIPPSVHTDGVATLAQLQTWFDDIYDTARQAALVPAGRPGLEGQLAGRIMAAFKFAPKAVDVEDGNDNEGNSSSPPSDAEVLLAKVQRLVHKGDLTAAVGLLESLPNGQARLTLADWKDSVLKRIMVDKAIKVIKMECALLNESLV